MPFVSITRLRLRSIRYLPVFVVYTLPAILQARRAAGFRRDALLPDAHWTFWTMTSWTDEAAMRAYILSGSHRRAMPHLMRWCDEASVVHWTSDTDELPSWAEADARMRSMGRPSKLRHASPHHADLTFASPRGIGAGAALSGRGV